MTVPTFRCILHPNGRIESVRPQDPEKNPAITADIEDRKTGSQYNSQTYGFC